MCLVIVFIRLGENLFPGRHARASILNDELTHAQVVRLQSTGQDLRQVKTDQKGHEGGSGALLILCPILETCPLEKADI